MRPEGVINSDVSFSVIINRTHTGCNKEECGPQALAPANTAQPWRVGVQQKSVSGKLIHNPVSPFSGVLSKVLGSLPTDQEVLRELPLGKL